MGTRSGTLDIASVLFGKTRRAVLGLLYGHPDESFYVRQIVRSAKAGQGAVQRELGLLADAGIIRRVARGSNVYYQVNRNCPVFGELRAMVAKTLGVAGVLQAALAPFADRIEFALVFGSVAGAREHRGSDVDLLVVGDVSLADLVNCLGPAQDALGREIAPVTYPSAEFRQKVAAGRHFVSNVLRTPRILLLGDEHELERLAGQRLARGAPDKRGRDRRLASHRRPGSRRLPYTRPQP